ncbi:MAG: RNA 3'-terminal-phosphate cyclase [Gammaproteobacteria bacterium RBG_16_57_12]|nr:MAG: RNA 3'-terminal-phosphate cyclase [Gammaproteobacteria bacterium RBG_16_57_12]
MLTINGTLGEGGGQILRSALALSLCLGRPFRISNIRATRSRPGLMPQHLVAVTAAAAVGDAEVRGATPGSRELEFVPRTIKPGEYRFDIGTAGSTTLVLQTILPALLTAAAPSHIRLQGGTHNPLAPSLDFFQHAFVPLINRMGPRIQTRQERPGFYPVGGGIVEVLIEPISSLQPLSLLERGEIVSRRAWAMVSRLPEHIARRELEVIEQQLGLPTSALELRQVEAKGPGNALTVLIESEHVTEVFAGIGERGVPAETVAQGVVAEVQRYLAAGVPVGEHLADQLLLPLALAGGGSFITLRPSRHTNTNMEVIKHFTGLQFACEELGEDRWRISC